MRRTQLIVGLAALTVGAVLLGYVGWQLWGTNWVSHRKQARIVEAEERAWNDGGEAVTADGTANALVRIPRFGEGWVIPVLEGTDDGVLQAGFGHFVDTADAGEVGNYALAAHRVTHGEPLRRMPELQAGDEVIIETPDRVLTYVLDTGGDDLVVDFSEEWVTDPLPRNPDEDEVEPEQVVGQRLITLTTCAELFHTDDRMIAFGHLETVERKQ